MPTSQPPLKSKSLFTPCRQILLLLLFTFPLWGDPVLVIPEATIDYGERRTGEALSLSFTLRNEGDEQLRISGIRTSCGCTTPQKERMTIPAGGTGEIPVRINLKGRTGPQRQQITFFTNDPKQPRGTLLMEGVALADITIEPRTLNLGIIDPVKPEPGVVTLKSTRDTPFEITKVRTQKQRLDVDIQPSEDGLSATLKVSPKPIEGQGQFTDVILVETSDKTLQSERILVMWQISNGVSVAPSALNLVVSEQLQLVNRYLLVKDYPGNETPLEVQDVTWPGHEQVEIQLQDTKRFGWRIHLKQFTPTQEMDGSQLVITTNAKGFETITVPVNVIK